LGCQNFGTLKSHDFSSFIVEERSVQPAHESETLLEMLVHWEELRQQGRTATPEELCPDDVRLQALLRERLARRQRLHAALDLPGVTRHEQVAKPASLPVIDGYEIGELLGRGGMGLVFKARHKALKRDVALKIVVSGAHAGAEERARLRTEAEAAARLSHPGIVQIYDVGEQDGCPYLALEFVSGGSLAGQLDGTPMPPRRAAQLLLDLARAVQHAHELGIVHRDLKPANVLMTDTGVAKIADFGLAKLLDVEQGRTRTGAVFGTPQYMAPEQAAGNIRAIGPATDIYALGAILYELLTGRPPFLGASTLETLDQVRAQDPASPQVLQPKVPCDLATICLKCLEKQGDKRYPTAQALADDLACFLAGQPIQARPVSQGEKLWRWCRRKPLVASLLASVSLLVLFVAAGTPLAAFLWREQRDEARQKERHAASAELDAREKLRESYLSQAVLLRSTKQSGQRFQGLELLSQASSIRHSSDVRNSAIACLALTDLKIARQWPLPAGSITEGAAFDATLERYAYKADRLSRICVRNTADDRQLMVLPGPDTPAWAFEMKFSPDGRFLAAIYGLPDARQNRAFVWDLSQGAKMFEKPSAPRGFGLDFSPDSSRIALAGSDGSIGIFAITGGRQLSRLEKSCRPHTLAFDPTGQRLAVSSLEDHLVEIRDLDNAGRVAAKFAHPSGVYHSAWRGDGKLLATGCNDRNAYVWDVSAKRQLAVLTGHKGPIPTVVFNHTGDLLASASWDFTTKLWDPVGGANLLTVHGHCHHFDRDDEHLAFDDGPELGIWQVAGRRECRTLHFGRVGRPAPEVDNGGPWGVDFSSDGQLLAAAGEDGVRLWEMPMAREVAHLPAGRTESALFPPAETSLITYGPEGLQRWPIQCDDARRSEARPGQSVLFRPAAKSDRYRAALSQDGNTIAFLDLANQQTIVRDAKNPAKQLVLKCSARGFDVSLSPNAHWDSGWAAVGNWRDTKGAWVWDLKKGTTTPIWQLPSPGSCRVAFSPDGQWFVSCEQDQYRFWKVGSWTPGLVIPRDRLEPGPGPLAFSRDCRILAIARSAWSVQLINPATGDEIATLAAPDPQIINSLCFSLDGHLAVATNNHTIQLWDLRLIQRQLVDLNLD
jgi:serine/threonine protein kinase/WD40 repeat protein